MIQGVFNFANPDTVERLVKGIRKLPADRRYQVRIEEFSAPRSVTFNRYYFVALVEPFRKYMSDHGQPMTSDEAHNLIKQQVVERVVSDPLTGDPWGKAIPGTHDMTNKQFADFFEQACAWVSENCGIVVEEPMYYRTHGYRKEQKECAA